MQSRSFSAFSAPPREVQFVLRHYRDPSAPPADTGALYVADNSGSRELRVRFHTGSPVVIATEP